MLENSTFYAFAFPAAYMFPFLIALLRRTHNVGGVFLLNLLLGWTVIGWIVAFVMACGSSGKVKAT